MSSTRTIDQLFAYLLTEDRKVTNPIKKTRLVLLETPYCISTDASFLIHHLIAFHLKNDMRVVLVSFLNCFKHYNSIGLKLGINLTTSISEGTFTFIDCFSQNDVNLVGCESKDYLSHLSARLQDCITRHYVNSPDVPLILLLDDFSTPVILGESLVRTLDLVFSTCALLEAKSALQSSVCLHVSVLEELESTESKLVRHLASESDVILTVQGLATGICKEVHGKLISRCRRTLSTIAWQREECHYKLEDRGVKLFAIGTASGVL